MKNEPKSYSVKFYAEKKLDDGRVIATEDEQFNVGSKVFAISDDGNAEALSAGSYTLEDGDKITVGDSSEILDLGEDKEDQPVEAKEEELANEVTEELAEESIAEETDWAKTYEELKDRVAELEEKVFGKKAEKETEELAESIAEETDWAKTYEEMKDRIEALERAVYGENVEASAEEKTEMSSEDIIGELTTEVEELKNKIVELSNEPADEGISYSPEGMKNATSTIDLRKLSTKERVAYYINNK